MDTIGHWAAMCLQQPLLDPSCARRAATAWAEAKNNDLPANAPWSSAWLKNEYHETIVGGGVESLDQYLRQSRIGSGGALSRRYRLLLWNFFDSYRRALAKQGIWEEKELCRKASKRIENGKLDLKYRAVVVDDVQELSPSALRLIRNMVGQGPSDLFLVGDAWQRIQGRPVALSECGIHVDGRKYALNTYHRSLDEVRTWAHAWFQGMVVDDLDGGLSVLEGAQNSTDGPSLEYQLCETRRAELEAIRDHISHLVPNLGTDSVCVVVRTPDQLKQYKSELQQEDYVWRSVSEERAGWSSSGAWMATMSEVKGLEFDHVIVAGVRRGKMPLRKALTGLEGVARRQAFQREFSLLYLALTRARKSVLVTGHGTASILFVGSN